MRCEDCVGNLIIGEASIDRFLAEQPQPRTRADYPSLVAGVLRGQPRPSAGGEHPKFAVYAGGCHLLVKFASGVGPAADRWRDLLVCEHLAFEVLREAGASVPHSAWFDLDGSRYLELDRFDRVSRQGRIGVISLSAINGHLLGGAPERWSKASRRILEEPRLDIDAGSADRMVWLDTFGALIGNTDRHFGNFSVFTEARHWVLAPTTKYDMVINIDDNVYVVMVERRFESRPPTALNLHLWPDVARQALR